MGVVDHLLTIQAQEGRKVSGLHPPDWRRSSYCESFGCVEVAMDGEIAVRDSKNPDGGQLRFSKEEWHAFVHGLRSGDFGLN